MKQQDYFSKYIYEPLGIKDLTVFPRGEQVDRFASFHQRDPPDNPNSKIKVTPRLPWLNKYFETYHAFQLGGSTTFGTMEEYVKVPLAIANNGTSPTTGGQILKPETVEYIFSYEDSQFGKKKRGYGEKRTPASWSCTEEHSMPGREGKRKAASLIGQKELEPQGGDPSNGSANTIWWAGAPNMYWWCDRVNGFAGMCGTHMLPFYGESTFCW